MSRRNDPQPRIRVAAIILRDNNLLLARHLKEGRTYWLLPGGGVDYGESLEKAIVRELKEEAQLDIEVERLVFVNDSIPPDRHRHVINVYFTARITGGEPQLGQDERVAEVRFVPVDQLPGLTFYPDICTELLTAIEQGFPDHARYLGNLWRD